MAENGAKSIGLIGRSKLSDTEYQKVRDLETKTGAKFYTFQVIWCVTFMVVNSQTVTTSFSQLEMLSCICTILEK